MNKELMLADSQFDITDINGVNTIDHDTCDMTNDDIFYDNVIYGKIKKDEIKDFLLVTALENYIDNKANFSNLATLLINNNIISEKSISDDNKNIRDNISNQLQKLKNNNNTNNNNNNIKGKYNGYNGEFKKIGYIGSGAYGTVDKVKNKFDNKEYAIKHIQIQKDIKYKKTLREVKIMANLSHKNIIRYHNSWISNNKPTNICGINKLTNNLNNNKLIKYNPVLHIQMELCDMTLKDYINMRKSINYDENILIMRGIIDGVKYLHDKNIIHRDLNPTNILLTKDLVVKISDFGISIKDGEEIYDNPSYIYGNPIYTAPEVDNKNITKKMDIYSVGMIFYELEKIFHTNMERAKSMSNPVTDNDIIKSMIAEYDSRIDNLDNIII